MPLGGMLSGGATAVLLAAMARADEGDLWTLAGLVPGEVDREQLEILRRNLAVAPPAR